MKKIVAVGVLLVVVALSSTASFAIGNKALRGVRGLSTLNNIVTRAVATQGRTQYYQAVKVCKVGGQKFALQVPSSLVFDRTNTMQSYWKLVARSYQKAFHELPKELSSTVIVSTTPRYDAIQYAISKEWAERYGDRAVYTDLNVLARDLDAFYDGKSDIYIDPQNRRVKLYTFPVDGIVYRPAGYQPIVLKADEQFIVFDIESQTGRMEPNRYTWQEMFRLASDEELYGEFETVEESGVVSMRPKSPWGHYEWEKNMAKDNPYRAQRWEVDNYPTQFDSYDELGKALSSFHGTSVAKVMDLRTGFVSYVYELPKVLKCALGENTTAVLDPAEDVMLYIDGVGGNIVSRADLENPMLFEFVK